MHESAHRLLFSNRRVPTISSGKWLVAYPAFVPIDLYRRGHMAHHREEFGPNEPDIPLYRGYPIPRDSFRRKLTRDAARHHRVEAHEGPLPRRRRRARAGRGRRHAASSRCSS